MQHQSSTPAESGERVTEDASQTASPTLVFDALADDRRRAILDSLRRESADELTVDALCDAVASRLDGPTIDRDDLRIALRHQHVPKLETAGLVDYDPRTGRVRYRGDSLLERCLDLVAAHEGSDG